MDLNHPLLQAADDEPIPFPDTFPQLRRLDRAVVCPICKEFYKAPVSISCGHSFCSACIRSSLDVSKKCPSCHEAVKEGSIRRNRVLEEMTDAWEAARPSLLDLAKPPRKRPSLDSHSLPSKRMRNGKAREDPETDDEVELVADPSDVDNDKELSDNDEAPCPICSARMPIAAISSHIDRGCPPPKAKAGSSGNQKQDWKKLFSGAGSSKAKVVADMKRIVKPNYSLTSTGELRALLNEHGLPTNGDRPTLESRFQEWIVLFNANLDTSHPSSLPALRAQLATLEASRKRDKERGKDGEVEALQSREGFKKHAREQRSEFERLREEILERKRKRSGMAVDTAIEVE